MMPRLWLIMAAALLAMRGSAQELTVPQSTPAHEFQFVRMIYSNYSSGFGWGRGRSWTTDAPAAETHLMQGIRRLTAIDAASEGTALKLTDATLFDFPFLYAVEVGHWLLSDEEAARLRDYLLRGGFLMVDDFHGTQEWEVFTESMRKVFPDRPIVDVNSQDPIYHVRFDVDQRVQIPGIRGAINGQTWEKDGYMPGWRGIYDDEGRLMVSINFNMDLGDAWEHADNPQYPVHYTILAYEITSDYMLYAMTH
jgi:hypothetical protein